MSGIHYDLLVLGGGIIGLSCARAIRLRHPELTVGIVDAPTNAMPASQAAAGMLAPYAEAAEDSPLARLCEQSLRLYPEFIEQLVRETGEAVTFTQAGTLIPMTEKSEENFAQRVRHYESRGIEFRLLPGEELRRAEPRLSGEITQAIWLPESLVNARELHRALVQFANQHHIDWIEDRAIESQNADHSIVALKMQSGREISFDRLITATGAWSNDVARLLDLQFDVQPVKGQVTCIAAPDDYLHHVIHSTGIYLAPQPGFGIVIGSTMENKGFDTSVDETVIADFIIRANELVPGVADFRVVESWSGVRPRSADGAPIIGWSPRWDNVIVATGHFRNGILLTPITGDLVAAVYDEGDNKVCEAFSPARFHARSKEERIAR